MNKTIKMSQIRTIAGLVERQLRGFLSPEKKVSQLEKDLLLENLRSLYVHISNIEVDEYDLNIDNDSFEEKQNNIDTIKESVVEQDSSEIYELKNKLNALKKQFDFLKQHEEELLKEEVESTTSDVVGDIKQESVSIVEEKSDDAIVDDNNETHDVAKSIGDTFDDNNTLNDVLSVRGGEQTIASKVYGHKISSIKDAIDINNKFLFIRELFNNNAADYNATINTINSLSTKAEVLKVISEKKEAYLWTSELDAYNVFMEIVNKAVN